MKRDQKHEPGSFDSYNLPSEFQEGTLQAIAYSTYINARRLSRSEIERRIQSFQRNQSNFSSPVSMEDYVMSYSEIPPGVTRDSFNQMYVEIITDLKKKTNKKKKQKTTQVSKPPPKPPRGPPPPPPSLLPLTIR